MPIEVFDSRLTTSVIGQNEHRKSWKNHDTLHSLRAMFWEEYQEYRHAKELCMLGADPYELASEVGDLGYLYIKLCEVTKDSVDEDIEFVIQSVAEECDHLGLSFAHAVWFKIFRNDIKYSWMISSNGFDHQTAKKLSKEQYALLGGDKTFYYAYMIMADSLLHDSDSQTA